MNTGVEGGETANKLLENGDILKKVYPITRRIILLKEIFGVEP